MTKDKLLFAFGAYCVGSGLIMAMAILGVLLQLIGVIQYDGTLSCSS